MTDLTTVLERHRAGGTAPGIVAALGRADGALEVAGVGTLEEDSIVRISSMSKPVLAIATLRLVEAGRLGLDDPVQRWLPELADRQVLRSPSADLADTVDAVRPITVRHLLTSTAGYGMVLVPSPLQQAMAANGTEAGPAPWTLTSQAWLGALAELPLVGQPGEVWRYHHSFGLLGILLTRLTGRPVGQHLVTDLLAPLGMVDTGPTVPVRKAHRLPAAYRRAQDGSLVELDRAGGGHYVESEAVDVSHGELVSTVRDYAVFARMLAAHGVHDGTQIVDPALLREMCTDQVPPAVKTPDSFFPGFWKDTGWGFGVAVETGGEHAGRFGWSGGLGTDFFADPGGRYGVLLTQVEMGPPTVGLIADLRAL